MDELIGQIVELMLRYSNLKALKGKSLDTNDIKDMISAVEELLKLKDKELSAFHKLFCASAHSFKQTQVPVMFDAACDQTKKEYKSLENLRKSLKKIKPIDDE